MIQLPKIMALIFVGTLSACGDQWLAQGMDTVKGQDVRSLYPVWGRPQSEGVVAGERYYQWSSERQYSTSTPVYNTASVDVSTYGGVGISNTSGTIGYTTYRTDSGTAICKIRVYVDKRDRILDYDINGNDAGCSRYKAAIKPLADSH